MTAFNILLVKCVMHRAKCHPMKGLENSKCQLYIMYGIFEILIKIIRIDRRSDTLF